MKKVVLANGLKVIYKKKVGKAVAIQVMVEIGSNHEEKHERGITHFLEHLLFEGTTTRPTNELISNEIEKIGGDFNAYTSNERTCYYVKVLGKHFEKGVEILADILQNPLFKKEHVEKEKNIVLKEINMMHDEPGYYQWILLQKHLFKKHPAKNPTYGDVKVIQGLTREKVVTYFSKYYVPNNMTICITGDIKNWKKVVAKYFTAKPGKNISFKHARETTSTKNSMHVEKRKMRNTYNVIAFKGVPRPHKDGYILDVINGILGRGQSGRMFVEIRGKRGLAYEVGTEHAADLSMGYFAVYATIDRKNVKLVRKVILDEIAKLQNVTQKDIKEAKEFIEGNYLLELEDVQKVADQVLFWEQVRDVKLMDSFLKNIKRVTVADVKRVAKKYLKNYTHVVLEGK